MKITGEKEVIETLGTDYDKLLVQKSKPLLALSQSDITLSEFKILDTYLARIDSHNPEKRTVVFTKGELEELMGVQKINNRDLKLRLKHLMGSIVEISDDEEDEEGRLITLFQEAVLKRSESGVLQITLECTPKAMKYFFNIDNIGYLKYKLKYITALSSRYSYIMFVYLETNRYRKKWEINLLELKKLLKCDKEETYVKYKRFNELILKRVQSELHEKTECRFEYEPIRQGRLVGSVRFILKKMPEMLPEYNNDIITVNYREKYLWEDAINDLPLNDEQVAEINSLLSTVPTHLLPESPACPDNIDISKYHYIDSKIKEIDRRNIQIPIANKFSYLIKLIKEDTYKKSS